MILAAIILIIIIVSILIYQKRCKTKQQSVRDYSVSCLILSDTKKKKGNRELKRNLDSVTMADSPTTESDAAEKKLAAEEPNSLKETSVDPY